MRKRPVILPLLIPLLSIAKFLIGIAALKGRGGVENARVWRSSSVGPGESLRCRRRRKLAGGAGKSSLRNPKFWTGVPIKEIGLRRVNKNQAPRCILRRVRYSALRGPC